MLTNFINEAANEMFFGAVQSGAGRAAMSEDDKPVIKRNDRRFERETETVNIYDRAREIYYRSRRSQSVRPVSIL